MTTAFTEHLRGELSVLEEGGLYKAERVITSPQSANITVTGGQEVLNVCANNYLGLADHPGLVEAAKAALEAWANYVAKLVGDEPESNVVDLRRKAK